MESAIEKTLEIIGSYNLLNNLLPGAAFCFINNKLNGLNFSSENLIETIFIYYFIGLIISRLGSLVVEPLCKKIKFVKFAENNRFVSACSQDSKIETLSEINNMYRTFLALSITLLLVKAYLMLAATYLWVKIAIQIIVPVIIFFIFALSYKKQTKYIKERVEGKNNTK